MGSEVDRSWSIHKEGNVSETPFFRTRPSLNSLVNFNGFERKYLVVQLDVRGFVNNNVLEKRGFVLKMIYSNPKKTYFIWNFLFYNKILAKEIKINPHRRNSQYVGKGLKVPTNKDNRKQNLRKIIKVLTICSNVVYLVQFWLLENWVKKPDI